MIFFEESILAKVGNTIFVNKYFEVYENQIEILKNIVKIKSDDVYDFINKNSAEDYQEPVTEENEDEIPKKTKVKDTIFTNPRFYELQKLRMPVYNIPRIISCFEEDERFLILPRGCIDGIKDICTKSNVELKVKDTREIGEKIDFKFNGKLTSKQTKAMNELLNYDIGVLCATTGFGKTVIASKIISELKTNTLILVNRTSLLEQWKERLWTSYNR